MLKMIILFQLFYFNKIFVIKEVSSIEGNSELIKKFVKLETRKSSKFKKLFKFQKLFKLEN